MTQKALTDYHDNECDEDSLVSAPGPVVVYRCAERRVVDITSIRAYDPDSSQWFLEPRLSGTDASGRPMTLTEYIRIGRGTPIGASAEAAQVVTAAAAYP